MGPVAADPAAPTATPAVRARRAGFTYKSGKVALHPTDLTVDRGTIVGLIGPNGAGKSTLLKLIATALTPTAGALNVLGLRTATEIRRNLGYLPDEAALFEELSALEQLALFARIRGSSESPAALLSELGLAPDDARNRTSTYSFGMRRRVALAQAFIGKPALLVLDEPTIGLDADARERTARALRTRTHDGATVVLSANDLGFAEGVCDRVVLLHEGSIVLEGAPADLLRDLRTLVSYRVQTEDELSPGEMPAGFTFTEVDVRTGIFRTAGGSLSDLVFALDRAGNRISSLEVHRADLSDVFREATGIGWTPGTGAPQ